MPIWMLLPEPGPYMGPYPEPNPEPYLEPYPEPQYLEGRYPCGLGVADMLVMNCGSIENL